MRLSSDGPQIQLVRTELSQGYPAKEDFRISSPGLKSEIARTEGASRIPFLVKDLLVVDPNLYSSFLNRKVQGEPFIVLYGVLNDRRATEVTAGEFRPAFGPPRTANDLDLLSHNVIPFGSFLA